VYNPCSREPGADICPLALEAGAGKLREEKTCTFAINEPLKLAFYSFS
jgi:hypothetical protein